MLRFKFQQFTYQNVPIENVYSFYSKKTTPTLPRTQLHIGESWGPPLASSNLDKQITIRTFSRLFIINIMNRYGRHLHAK